MPGCRYGGLPDLPNALPLRPQLPSCVSDQGYVAEGWEVDGLPWGQQTT